MTESNTRGILKKITMAACGAKPDIEKVIAYKNQHGENVVMPLLTVDGIVSDFKAGAGKDGMGDYVKFLGHFRAVNIETGQVFISGAAILPGAAPDLVYGALRALGEAGGSVEFSFNFGVHFDSTAVTKYVYDVQQIAAPGQADPLAALVARRQAALPAPGNATPAEENAAVARYPGRNSRKAA